jgi:hypothetical protein
VLRAANNDSEGKPFVYDELVARMRAVLRRSNGPRHPRLTVRDLEIDLASRVVTLAGEAVQLSALAEDPERVFKKDELLGNVWGFSLAWSHEDAGLSRVAVATQAQRWERHGLRAQRLGRRVPAGLHVELTFGFPPGESCTPRPYRPGCPIGISRAELLVVTVPVGRAIAWLVVAKRTPEAPVG